MNSEEVLSVNFAYHFCAQESTRKWMKLNMRRRLGVVLYCYRSKKNFQMENIHTKTRTPKYADSLYEDDE